LAFWHSPPWDTLLRPAQFTPGPPFFAAVVLHSSTIRGSLPRTAPFLLRGPFMSLDIVLLTPRRRFHANRVGLGYQIPLGLVFLGGPLLDAG
jgi:hypothetical protein